MFVIESLSRTKSVFFSDGAARSIEFSLTLKRTDENLKEMFCDLSQQLNDLSGALFETLCGLLS